MHCYAPSFEEVERAKWFGPVCLSIHLPLPPPPHTHTPDPHFLDLDSVSNKFNTFTYSCPASPYPPPPPPQKKKKKKILIWIQSKKFTYSSPPPPPPNRITAPPPHPRHFPHFLYFRLVRSGMDFKIILQC